MAITLLVILLAWLGINGMIIWFCYRKGCELEVMREMNREIGEEIEELNKIERVDQDGTIHYIEGMQKEGKMNEKHFN